MTWPNEFNADDAVLLVGLFMASVMVTIIALGVRRRRRLRARRNDGALSGAAPVAALPMLDADALNAQIRDAEAAGQVQRLPGLFLSLAEWHMLRGEKAAAAELLRKSVRSATGDDLKETRAKGRVALGDIAHAEGDLATACEHWQIARSLYRELGIAGQHDEVDERMQRNGCPTDWVLTDF